MKILNKVLNVLALIFVILPLSSLADGTHRITVINKHPNKSFNLGSATLNHGSMTMSFDQPLLSTLSPSGSSDTTFRYLDVTDEIASYMVKLVYLDPAGQQVCLFTLSMFPQSVEPGRKGKQTLTYTHDAKAVKLGNVNCSYQITGHHTNFIIGK